jgi:putative copper resistance protein D
MGLSIVRGRFRMKMFGLCLLSSFILVVIPFHWLSHVQAQLSSHPVIAGEGGAAHSSHGIHGGEKWEGSSQGVAYSEFNHRFAGLFVLLFGLAELGHALRYQLPFWTRLVLPGALGVIGTYLLIWSDHEAWPIGSLSFVQTFSGQDPEILQHKFYGVFALTAAVSETLRRIGWTHHPAWAAPLLFFGVSGALLLFFHSHGNHPGNHTVELHHALLGSLGVGAAMSNAMVSWTSRASNRSPKRWEVAWAGFVIIIGIQLLLYFE